MSLIVIGAIIGALLGGVPGAIIGGLVGYGAGFVIQPTSASQLRSSAGAARPAVQQVRHGHARSRQLPGDLRFGSGNTRIYIPITSMIIVSVLLTVIVNLLRR